MAIGPQQKDPPSHDLIAAIGGYLEPELAQVEHVLRDVLASDSRLIREIGEYICFASGKKLRPMLTLLVARAFGKNDIPPVQIAAAMEAVHVATLLHDDVIDKALLRRGSPSVNARWGDDTAILMADYLYASAFELALHHLQPEPLRLICEVTRRMCEGEMFQIERRGQWLTAEDYLHIISCKTAYLFSACGAMGSIAAGLGMSETGQVSAFGLDFGLAFQITDDALDFTAQDQQWGKMVGMDIATGKQTLPLILALQAANEEDRRRIKSVIGDGRDYRQVLDLLERHGAIEQALGVAREYAGQCTQHLQGLEVRDEPAYEYLLSLPEYVIARRY